MPRLLLPLYLVALSGLSCRVLRNRLVNCLVSTREDEGEAGVVYLPPSEGEARDRGRKGLVTPDRRKLVLGVVSRPDIVSCVTDRIEM